MRRLTLPANEARTRILVSAGGSGGHVFPAQAFAEAIEAADPSVETVFVTGEKFARGRDFFDEIPAGRVVRIKSAAFRGIRSALSLSFYTLLGKGFGESRSAIARFSPALVVGFGGHHTVPIVLAARAAGIPTLLHEQNATFGLANGLLSRFATRTACAFEPPTSAARCFRAGMPLRAGLRRAAREEAVAKLGLDLGKKTLLVAGGSQGARGVNDGVLKFVAQYGAELQKNWQIVHLTGSSDFERVDAFYETSPVPARRFAFCDDMSSAYSASDLVVCRAGAVTLHELAFFEKCAILVPYPAANGHQLHNARVLESRGAAFVVEQKDFGAGAMREALAQMDADPQIAARTGRACAVALSADPGLLVTEALRLAAGRNQRRGVDAV